MTIGGTSIFYLFTSISRD